MGHHTTHLQCMGCTYDLATPTPGPSTAPSLHTCIPVAPGGGVVYITTEMEHGDTSSVGRCGQTDVGFK